MSIHQEIQFESEICADMAATGWLYMPSQGNTVSPDAAGYNTEFAIFPDDLRDWIAESQPQVWERLVQGHGDRAITEVMARLRKALDAQDTLYVLRHGIEMLGLRHPIALAQFKPASGMNPELAARYRANCLRVVRQVHYSTQDTGRSLDLVLMNGLPIATAELKTDYTQAVENAIYQYKRDRNPRPPERNTPEPLLSFPGGALIHFAVSNTPRAPAKPTASPRPRTCSQNCTTTRTAKSSTVSLSSRTGRCSMSSSRKP